MRQIQSFFLVFFLFIMLGHLSACFWLYLGMLDKYLPAEEQTSWIYADESLASLSDGAVYIFSYYWIFETFTTVGYGDYSGGNSREYTVTILFEFIGFCYNAVLISIMSSFFASEITFEDLLNSRMEEMELWIKRIEKSYKPYYLHPQLNVNISETVRDAFHFDFNLIVEEYDLYQQLTPKMQTELITKIFHKFINRFNNFFNSCETGFRNEFIIQLFARNYTPNSEIQRYGREADEVVLVTGGMVDMLSYEGVKFMHLPPNTIFNDY